MAGGGAPAAELRRGIGRLLLLPCGEAASSLPPPKEGRGKGFASVALRRLGCKSEAASQAYEPAAAVRSSADWHGRRRRRKEKERSGGVGGGPGGGGIGGDVWCAPGIPFAAEASSVDCVVLPHQTAGRERGSGRRGAAGEADRPHRERPCMSRRATAQEQIPQPSMDSPPHVDAPFFDADHRPTGRLRRMRGYRQAPIGLEEEVLMFRTRVLLGATNRYDRYRDWRLDVDNMTYEELLELGDRIGHVSTGLREEEIVRILRKAKHSEIGSLRFATEMERKCSICQEELGASEDVGWLSCGHSYHVYCIKQWLSQKDACPVCKTAVSET